MDFSKNVVLKENYTFLVADEEGALGGGERGLYNRDTRFLDRYRWRSRPALQTLLQHSPRPDRLHVHQALMGHHHQLLALRRELELDARGFRDRIWVENTGSEPRELELELEFSADFIDLFEARGWDHLEREIESEAEGSTAAFRYRARDGMSLETQLSFAEPPRELEPATARFALDLAPGERRQLELRVDIHNPLEDGLPGTDYETWRRRFAGVEAPADRAPVLQRAIDDLRALLLFTEQGPVPSAGIPWFVATFGRDSLLTAYMMLPHIPEVAVGTLRYLARHQGRERDPFRAEERGKIMHELRFGELARTGRVPHSPYYGTVDSTPLFLMLLEALWRSTGDPATIVELRPHWEAALEWMRSTGDEDGDGFLEFRPAEPGRGLTVQSWKDSPDSMSHADGSLASGAIAVSEVQGYAYAAYRAAGDFYEALGEGAEASSWRRAALELRERFQEAFWLEDMGTYALALDGSKAPLRVQSSDAGQLLWSGIVAEEFAPRLVESLFSDASWSGWGFRTLGADEARYNPVSYHNGSVWPHDSALIAGGLARYGFHGAAARVRDALLDLAASQVDLRPPELIGGYPRRLSLSGLGSEPPIPYPVACRPQAWDAAAVIYLLSLDI